MSQACSFAGSSPQTARPTAARLGVELLAQRLQAFAGGHDAALDDEGPASGGLGALVEPEAGAGVNPVPAFGRVAFFPTRRGLAPLIAFADVPSVDLQDHLIRLQRELQLARGRRGGVRVEFAPQRLRPGALAARFPIKRGARHFDPGEPFQHQARFADGHLAGEQRGHLLHRRRVAGALGQTQHRVGRRAPFAATARAPRGLLANRVHAPSLSCQPRN